MILNKLLFIFLALFSQCCAAQEPEIYIRGDFTTFTTDPMGHVFAVEADQTIVKYRDTVKLLSVNHRVYGAVHSIDASNPFEIYLFYKEAGYILITDNQLSIRNVIDLNQTRILPAAIARSYDNGIWIFDISDQQLKKFDKQLKLLHESGNVLRFSQNTQDIYSIQDLENAVYVFDKSGRLEEFDIFSNHIRTLKSKSDAPGQIVGKNWIYMSGGIVYRFDLDVFDERVLCRVSTQNTGVFRYQTNRLFVLTDLGIQMITISD